MYCVYPNVTIYKMYLWAEMCDTGYCLLFTVYWDTSGNEYFTTCEESS